MFARPFHQHLDRAADELLAIFLADRVLHRQQFVVAAALDFFGHIVGPEIGGFRAGPFAVFEDEAVFEPRLANQLDGLLKFVLRLAAEADDKIAGHRGVGNGGANARSSSRGNTSTV